MKFKKFGMVISDTSRSRAYLQLLIINSTLPSKIIFLEPEIAKKNLQGKYTKSDKKESYKIFETSSFDPEISVLNSILSLNLKFITLKSKSINDQIVISCLKEAEEEYFIYSGFGGIILRKEVLSIGKKFIHVHGGFLPYFKGSTCNYYSIIENNFIGAASIIMNEKIDDGPVLLSKKFKSPKKKLKIDHYHDPLIRAIVLVETINLFLANNAKYKATESVTGDMYYVIHPVLKHISILK